MMSLPFAVGCDLVVLLAAVLSLRWFRDLRHSHPVIIYLFFHVYTVTLRAWKVVNGAPTLFSTWGFGFQGVGEDEIARAVLMADVTLVAMLAAWLAVPVAYKRAVERRGQRISRRLTLPYIWIVVLVVLPVGCAGLFYLANLPGSEENLALGDWQESSWLAITQTWPGLCFLVLIYWYGFRWWLLTPMTLYLLIMSYQGFHRFRVVIPVIMLVQIYLDRHGRKWPTLAMMSVLVALGLLFFPLKAIGMMAQWGYSASDIVRNSTEIVETALAGEHDDQGFLDQMASVLTLVDERGKHYWGQPYAALVTLPIPRQWWQEKPTPADYIEDFSTKARPMRECGMIATIVGESYANFGLAGIIVIPFLLAWLLGWLYTVAYSNNYFAVARFGYLMLACNLIQVFRDGIVSMIMFTAVNMMPLVVILLLHRLLPQPEDLRTHADLALPSLGR
jgi:hypothetical protein